MTTSLDKDILTLPGHDVIDMELDMRDELKKAQSFISEIYTHATVFVPGKMDEKVLNDMIGHIHKMSLGEINEIDRYSSPIVSIKAFSDTKAITRLKNDQYAKIISSTGEELGVVGAPCTDLIALNNGHLVLIGYMEALVSLLNNNGDEIRSFDTKPLRPYRISKTENDDILVSLRDFDGDFTLQPTSRRVIQRMRLTGKVLHTYEFREDGKTRLFTLPTGIAENKNTDVCVVNRLASDRGELIALHKDGRVKFAYSGDRLLSKMFAPLDVACDEKCHIMITEWYSKGVHVLNSKGIYLCELCQFERFHPSELSLFGETLWCGYREGNIKVFQYRH
ncbi:hypothetical protein FSP39_022981 [Pinctada imbricata]|uniref:Uncharacterized protein n=1 Tax=Pinctada imbricata TaxID=66713 RepID=A0AA88YR49_PINIB|nr:hypothetical protein FSP39_022981 [Pinctada imbricata]